MTENKPNVLQLKFLILVHQKVIDGDFGALASFATCMVA